MGRQKTKVISKQRNWINSKRRNYVDMKQIQYVHAWVDREKMQWTENS